MSVWAPRARHSKVQTLDVFWVLSGHSLSCRNSNKIMVRLQFQPWRPFLPRIAMISRTQRSIISNEALVLKLRLLYLSLEFATTQFSVRKGMAQFAAFIMLNIFYSLFSPCIGIQISQKMYATPFAWCLGAASSFPWCSHAQMKKWYYLHVWRNA